VGAGGRNEPSLYAHMNNKRKMKKKNKKLNILNKYCNQKLGEQSRAS
jgi:hypothetical protein